MKNTKKFGHLPILMLALILTLVLTISSCGYLVANIGTITIVSDKENSDNESFTAYDLKDVIVNNDKGKKTNIDKGQSKTFTVKWFGENQGIIPFAAYVETATGTKVYFTFNITVSNFDNLEVHYPHDDSKGPQVRKKTL